MVAWKNIKEEMENMCEWAKNTDGRICIGTYMEYKRKNIKKEIEKTGEWGKKKRKRTMGENAHWGPKCKNIKKKKEMEKRGKVGTRMQENVTTKRKIKVHKNTEMQWKIQVKWE